MISNIKTVYVCNLYAFEFVVSRAGLFRSEIVTGLKSRQASSSELNCFVFDFNIFGSLYFMCA